MSEEALQMVYESLGTALAKANAQHDFHEAYMDLKDAVVLIRERILNELSWGQGPS